MEIQSQRQDQPRALPLPAFRGDRDPGDPLRAEGLAGPAMEAVRSGHRLRSAIARGVLRRRIPILCRALRIDDEFGLAVCADFRQRRGNSDHDPGCLLHLLVEAAGQAAESAGTQAGLILQNPKVQVAC